MTRYFRPAGTDLKQHALQEVVATSPLPDDLYDRADVGPMYYATLGNGATVEAFGDELISDVEEVLYVDGDSMDLLIDGRHNVNFVPSVYSRFATDYRDRDGNPMRAEIHPTGRHWYVEVQR